MAITEKDIEKLVSGETIIKRAGAAVTFIAMYGDRMVVDMRRDKYSPSTSSFAKADWQNWTVKKKTEKRDLLAWVGKKSGDLCYRFRSHEWNNPCAFHRVPELDKLGVELET